MMKIYLVRHTHYDNFKNIIPGRLPIRISEKGIEQSKKLHEFFSDKNIEKIYSSPIKRCVETAEIMAGGTIQVVIDERLAETLTPCEGAHKEKIWRRQLYTSVLNIDGETPEEVRQRMIQFWENSNFHPEKNYIICSHGDPLFFLFQYLDRQTIHTDLNINKPVGYQPKGTVRLIEKNGEDILVHGYQENEDL